MFVFGMMGWLEQLSRKDLGHLKFLCKLHDKKSTFAKHACDGKEVSHEELLLVGTCN